MALMRFRQGIGEIGQGFAESAPDHTSPYQTSTIPYDSSPYPPTTYPSDHYQQPPFMGKPEPTGNSSYQPPSYWQEQGPFSRKREKGWPCHVTCSMEGACKSSQWELLCIDGLRHSLKLTGSFSHHEVILCACFQWCIAFLCLEINCMFVLPRADYQWLYKWCLNVMQVIVKLLTTEQAVTALKPRLLHNARQCWTLFQQCHIFTL